MFVPDGGGIETLYKINCGGGDRPCLVSMDPPALDAAVPQPLVEVIGNRGAWGPHHPYYLGVMEKNWSVPRDLIPGCLYRAMLVPNAKLIAYASKWLEVVDDPGTQVVGLHARFGDHVLSDRATIDDIDWAADKATACAVRIEKARDDDAAAAGGSGGAPLPPVRWLFMTDSKKYAAAASAHFGDSKLITTGIKPYHISIGQLAGDGVLDKPDTPDTLTRLLMAATEWFLFSRCDWQVIHGLSGFSRLAAAYAASADTVYDTDGCNRGGVWRYGFPDKGWLRR